MPLRKRPEFRPVQQCSDTRAESALSTSMNELCRCGRPFHDRIASKCGCGRLPSRVYAVVHVSRNPFARTIRLHQQIIMSAVHCD